MAKNMRVPIHEIVTDVVPSELFAELVPPAEFRAASFDNYFPQPGFPSQQEAATQAKSFATRAGSSKETLGIYLDGGFGVGKTHLLAAIFNKTKELSLFGSFVAYTSMIGFLGFQESISTFSKYSLLCIDEFELDDPGDTMIMSRFLKELSSKGVRFAATSNTPPNALGEGRFAADGFQREIQSVANRFTMCRIDGEDYRQRNSTYSFTETAQQDIDALIATQSRILLESLKDVLIFLASIHQSKYAKVAEQLDWLVILEIYQISDQFEGLRFVSFIDRCYEAGIRIKYTGLNLNEIFREDHVAGAYRKKYLRCLSRLSSMIA